MQPSAKERILKEFDEIQNLKTQEEDWMCDAGCGVDREKIKSFLSSAIDQVLEEVGKSLTSELTHDEWCKKKGEQFKECALCYIERKLSGSSHLSGEKITN